MLSPLVVVAVEVAVEAPPVVALMVPEELDSLLPYLLQETR